MGRLTTHVLDTARGRPAAGLRVELRTIEEPLRVLVDTTTNKDGRTDAPLLDDDAFRVGRYELRFHAASYQRSIGEAPRATPPFLDVVVIAFGISSEDEHYHVPLLLSPYGYTTYRGS